MKRVFIFIVTLFVLLLGGCGAQLVQELEPIEQAETIEEISARIDVEAAEFEQQMFGNYVLLDVRSYEEFEEGHIEGATLIPVDEIASRWVEIEEYDKILVYCRSGNRSVTASDILIEAGFDEVYNLLGGIKAWNEYKK